MDDLSSAVINSLEDAEPSGKELKALEPAGRELIFSDEAGLSKEGSIVLGSASRVSNRLVHQVTSRTSLFIKQQRGRTFGPLKVVETHMILSSHGSRLQRQMVGQLDPTPIAPG